MQQTKNNAHCSKVWSVVIWLQLNVPLKIYRQSSHQEVLLVAAAVATETHEISHAVSFLPVPKHKTRWSRQPLIENILTPARKIRPRVCAKRANNVRACCVSFARPNYIYSGLVLCGAHLRKNERGSRNHLPFALISTSFCNEFVLWYKFDCANGECMRESALGVRECFFLLVRDSVLHFLALRE